MSRRDVTKERHDSAEDNELDWFHSSAVGRLYLSGGDPKFCIHGNAFCPGAILDAIETLAEQSRVIDKQVLPDKIFACGENNI